MDESRTVWVGNLADEVTEELLYELFLQAAPLDRVKIPIDKQGKKSSYGFVTFKHEISVPYVVELLNDTRFFDKNITIKPRHVNNVAKDYVPHYENYHHRSNQHIRFHDADEVETDYNELMRMGQQMMNTYDHSGNDYGQWQRNNFRDHGRDHRDYNRPKHEFDRRANYHQNKRRNDRRNNSFDRIKRNNRHY